MISELAAAVTAADADPAIRCIVLTGSEKAFAAGADIKEMASKSYVDVLTGDLFGPEIEQINRVRKPIIAAVAGYALGGGCELAMMCDFIICAENAKFGQPEINLGVIAGIGGTHVGGTDRPPTAPALPAAALAAPEAAPLAASAAPEAALAASFAPSANIFCRPVRPLIPRQTAQRLFECMVI